MSNILSEEASIELSQLRWHCRRGVKELDVVLSNYLDNHYLDSDTIIQEAFKSLIKLEDPHLMSLVIDSSQVMEESKKHVLDRMKKPYGK